MAEAPGDMIADRYEIIGLAGAGGMGWVWRCRDTVLDRDVAIKRVDVRDSADAQRVIREAQMAAQVDHPGIVSVYDVVRHSDEPMIVMQLVNGRSLADILEDEGRLAPVRVAALGLEILDALEAAHLAGVVHMDLKPGNILFTEQRSMIADWGIAGRVDATTMAQAVGGTPLFMSPEHITEHVTSAASDLWSLGVTLYLAVEGRLPFHDGPLYAIARAILHDEPRPMRYAGALEPIISALLVKDFSQRATGGQTAQALRALLFPQPTREEPLRWTKITEDGRRRVIELRPDNVLVEWDENNPDHSRTGTWEQVASGELALTVDGSETTFHTLEFS